MGNQYSSEEVPEAVILEKLQLLKRDWMGVSVQETRQLVHELAHALLGYKTNNIYEHLSMLVATGTALEVDNLRKMFTGVNLQVRCDVMTNSDELLGLVVLKSLQLWGKDLEPNQTGTLIEWTLAHPAAEEVAFGVIYDSIDQGSFRSLSNFAAAVPFVKLLYSKVSTDYFAARILEHLAKNTNNMPHLLTEDTHAIVGATWHNNNAQCEFAIEIALHKPEQYAALACHLVLNYTDKILGSTHNLERRLCKLFKSKLVRELVKEAVTNQVLASSYSGEGLVQLYEGEQSKLLKVVVNAGVASNEIPWAIADEIVKYVATYASLILDASNETVPWYIAPTVLPSIAPHQQCLLPAKPSDVDFVRELYARDPIPGHDIKNVYIVHKEQSLVSFTGRIEMLEERHNKSVFAPRWNASGNLEQEVQRKHVNNMFIKLAVSHHLERAPHVSVLPLWHGLKQSTMTALHANEIADLLTVSFGKLGKGLYNFATAKNAWSVGKFEALLVNWVVAFSPYPVISQDEEELSSRGNYGNYDAHFGLLAPETINGSSHHHSQLVVFDPAQVLPHYIVELTEMESVNVTATVELASGSHVSKWTVDDVCNWTATLLLANSYVQELKEHYITGDVLLTMTQAPDWNEIGIQNIDDVCTLLLNVARLQ